MHFVEGSVKQLFIEAVKDGNIEVVKFLLEKIDVTNYNHAVVLAIKKGYTEIVKLLIVNDKVDPSFNNNEFIIEASAKGDIEIVRMLLADKRVDPSANNNKAIRSASEMSRNKIVKILLDNERANPFFQINKDIKRIAADNNNLTKTLKSLSTVITENNTTNDISKDNCTEQMKLLLEIKELLTALVNK